MTSEHARVGRALDLLTQGLAPYVERELRAAFGADWEAAARGSVRNDRIGPSEWDAYALLSILWDQWNAVFRKKLGLFERSLVSELREFRNRWAHQAACGPDDAYRLIDSAERLLAAMDAPATILGELEQIKLDTLRERLDRQVDDDRVRAGANRNLRIDVLLYSISGAAVIASTLLAIVPHNPHAGGLLVAFTLLTFGYLVYQRTRQPVIIRGVHECPTCRKIIYTAVCPYCAAPPTAMPAINGPAPQRLRTFHAVEQ